MATTVDYSLVRARKTRLRINWIGARSATKSNLNDYAFGSFSLHLVKRNTSFRIYFIRVTTVIRRASITDENRFRGPPPIILACLSFSFPLRVCAYMTG